MRTWNIIFLAAALSACKGAPVQEMSDARQAIDAARAAGAAQRAPDDLNAAQAAIESAEENLRDQHYTRARYAANEAKRHAAVALSNTRDGAAPNTRTSVPDVMPISR